MGQARDAQLGQRPGAPRLLAGVHAAEQHQRAQGLQGLRCPLPCAPGGALPLAPQGTGASTPTLGLAGAGSCTAGKKESSQAGHLRSPRVVRCSVVIRSWCLQTPGLGLPSRRSLDQSEGSGKDSVQGKAGLCRQSDSWCLALRLGHDFLQGILKDCPSWGCQAPCLPADCTGWGRPHQQGSQGQGLHLGSCAAWPCTGGTSHLSGTPVVQESGCAGCDRACCKPVSRHMTLDTQPESATTGAATTHQQGIQARPCLYLRGSLWPATPGSLWLANTWTAQQAGALQNTLTMQQHSQPEERG